MESIENKMSNVDLGFIDVPKHPWLLHRCYFPSKVGGKPAWLNPSHLPSSESLLCEVCLKPMLFLLQIYAPDEDDSNAFHRTVYVFCCKNGSCYMQDDNRPIRAFRCCLPRDNCYYSFDPPQYDSSEAYKNSTDPASLCQLCGCRGKKICSQCKKANYCHKDHQMLDWKRHKVECKKTNQHSGSSDVSKILFPEKELVMAEEKLELNSEQDSSESFVDRKIDSNYDANELNEVFAAQNEDKSFMKFRKRISLDVDQVIRYERCGKPLWCSDQHIPTNADIPPCPCGAPREYEFQIMPQLLNFLNVDTSIEDSTIDWGTVVIYTCTLNCVLDSSSAYVEEFVWKQNYSK